MEEKPPALSPFHWAARCSLGALAAFFVLGLIHSMATKPVGYVDLLGKMGIPDFTMYAVYLFLAALSLVSGLVALLGLPRHGRKGILKLALPGVIIGGLYLPTLLIPMLHSIK